MTHAGHAWAPIGTPGSAGIFSALSYFVAETPIIFLEERRNKIQSELSYDLFAILQRFLIEYDICILISLAMQFLQK